jgi:putative phage-type endonuclease
MKTLKFSTEEEWLEARQGKITGSKLGDITLKKGGGYKKGFYEIIADKVSIPDEKDVPSNPMERGHYLEPRAMDKFISDTKKDVDTSLVMWVRSDNKNIAVSPDGFIKKTEAVEVKCLSGASHIEAYLTKEIPKEYEFQVLQYFIVNDKLEKLYFVFYNPCIPAKDYFYYTIERESLKDKITEYLEFETKTLEDINKIVAELTF